MDLGALIHQYKVIAILRNLPLEKTLRYVGALYEGGIRLIEVALNSPKGFEQIALIREHMDGKLHVGAGTAVTAQLARRAIEAGASFLLTPSASREVLEFCAAHKVALLPGVMTPTDVETCLRYGFRTQKLFPASDLPANYIRSLKGPFQDTEYVAVGGVTAANAVEFLRRGFIGVGIGNGLMPSGSLQNDRWDDAQEKVRELMNNIQQYQTGDGTL